MISGSKLTIEDEATIESPPGTGRINPFPILKCQIQKRSFDLNQKNTENDAAAQVKSQGTWRSHKLPSINYQSSCKQCDADHANHFSGIEKSDW